MHERAPTRKRYRIVVKGRLSQGFAETFEGLTLATASTQSTLSGSFADQAQLYGLLDHLRDLGIELTSVNADE